MNKLPFFIPAMVAGAILFNGFSLSAQQIGAGVNNFTGSANVSVPIYTVRSGAVTIPISVVHNGSGVRVKDTEGTAGMNWHLVAGGEIRREIRGLPDDQKKDDAGNPRLGWLYTTNGAKVYNFTISNDNNVSTCPDETTDLNYINTNFSDLSDTEPDIYYVNAPGLNCQLIFDKDLNIKTMPYQDLKISYIIDSESHIPAHQYRIKSFTIINDQGLKYVFSDTETTTRTTSTSQNPNDIHYFKHEYEQYKGGIDYVSAWKLTSIHDVNNNTIGLTYLQSTSTTANSRIRLASGTDTTMTTPFSVTVRSYQRILDRIFYNDDDGVLMFDRSLRFSYGNAYTSSAALISSITGKGISAIFGYSRVKTKEPGSIKEKSFLKSISFNGIKAADFEYYGVTDSVIDMPDSLSKEIDQWGFYNASGVNTLLPAVYINPSNAALERYRVSYPDASISSYPYALFGATRTTNAAVVANGSLKTINHYYGGSTTLVYEPNDYHDPTAGAIIQGGGVRVKQIIDHDGISTGNEVIRNYNYNNPSTSQSSGKAVSMPLLAFSKPYTGSGTAEQKWQMSTLRLEESVSPEPGYIVYTHVKVSQAGAGSTLYEYTAPATFWDSSASPDWAPTITYIARPSCISAGYMTSLANTYPFLPNINFDFERGLTKKVTTYNSSSEKLTESIYTYTRMASPEAIQGLRYEYINGIAAYSKYSVFTGTDNLITQVQNIEYDAPSLTQYRSSTVNSYYGSPYHKLMTSQVTTGSDGSILKNYTKYVKDYTAGAGSDEAANSIYKLQQANANIPIENYSQVERGGISRTVSASLQTFINPDVPFEPDLVAPYQSLRFLNSEGVTNFQVSSISGGIFTRDSRYEVTSNNLVYNNKGLAITKDDNKKNIQTVLSNYNFYAPVAIFNNARADEIVYTDFDTEDAYSISFPFNVTGIILDSVDSRSGKFALSNTPSNEFSRTISKNPVAENYIFSMWIKTALSGNVTVSLTNSGSTTHTYNIPYANTNGSWKYYESKIPLTGMTATFTVKFKSSTNISVDDILFYPGHAELSTTAYNPDNYLKASETNSNGIAQYYVYDGNRRLRHVLDQDKNIVLKKTYMKDPELYDFKASISTGLNPVTNVPVYFTGSSEPSDGDGLVFSWDFGDGNTYTTMNTASFYHTYTQAGTYTVTLNKTSPFYGTATDTKTITVTDPLVTVQGHYIGGGGTVSWARFYNGTTLAYEFTGAQLLAGTHQITPGAYNVRILVSGSPYSSSNPSGYRRVNFVSSLPDRYGCVASETGTSIYDLYINAIGLTSIDVGIDNEECVPPMIDPLNNQQN